MSTRLAGQIKSTTIASMTPTPLGLLQRQCACGGTPGPTGECAACRRKRLLGGMLQPKLTINQPGDKYEQEADRVAGQVLRMPESGLQRRIEPEEELLQTKPLVQRQVAGQETAGVAPPIVHEVLGSPGQPLDAATRAFMVPRFGYDFNQVRVHSDARAAESARAVNALAYTVGNDIVFSTGRYAPPALNRQKLIAHELTHVVQQDSSSSNLLFREEETTDGNSASPQQQDAPSCGCSPPPTSSCARISSASGTRQDVVLQAFQTAAGWLPDAQAAMQEYVDAPSDERSSKPAAGPLRAHFNWPPSGSRPLRDTPSMVLGVINRLFNHFEQPVCPNCRDECPCTGDDDPWACVPGAWENSNCIEFCEPFFDHPARQAHVVVHEMMHAWEDKSDISYEHEGSPAYPPNALLAQRNADSYAALIRDLG